ncbi:MAG: cytochrome c oxidase assembly protein [Actinomycetota bacterium]
MSTAVVLAAAAVLYLTGVRRHDALRPGERFPRRRVWVFLAGLSALGLALVGPLEAAAGASFSWHMVQHLVIALVAAPLLLLGRPLLVVRRAGPPRGRRAVAAALRSRPVHAVTHPVAAWSTFVVVLWASHYTALYQLALERPAVHVLEHALYLGAAVLFWFPVLAVEPSPWRLGHGARLLYLFLALPANALLASSLFQADAVLYAHYAADPAALADQRSAAAIMWTGGGLLMLLAVVLVASSWARAERAAGRSADAPALPRPEGG